MRKKIIYPLIALLLVAIFFLLLNQGSEEYKKNLSTNEPETQYKEIIDEAEAPKKSLELEQAMLDRNLALDPSSSDRKKGPTWGNQKELFWKRFEEAGNDKDKIFQAFVLFLNSRFPVDEIRDISRSLLGHENPVVKLRAAYYLYLFKSGQDAYPTLVQILNNPPGESPEEKLAYQKKAFGLFVEFKEIRAKEELLRFYNNYEENKKLISILTRLGFVELLPDIDEQRKQTGYSFATNLAKLAPDAYVSEIKSEFENTKHERIKPELAKALFESTGSNEYLGYLQSLAEVAVNYYPNEPNKRKGRTTTDLPTTAFKHLASIKTPEVKSYLEDSLNSENPVVVETALVNLLLLHGDSPKALSKLKEVVGQRESKISEDTKLRLAFEVGDPAILQVFKDTYDKQYQGPSNYWWRYSNHRQHQSIYYWIDSYTVDYIEERDRPNKKS